MARANDAGGVDNVTVVLGRVGVGVMGPSGDTVETPAVDPDGAGPGAEGTSRMRVLGGVHGHAGAERTGMGPAPPPRVLEPAGRRRSRLVPVLVGLLLLVAAAVGVTAWIGSRTYTLEEGPGGTVQVAHGLPVSVLGQDLSTAWQDTGVSAAAVRQGQPDALSSTWRGQGEAVELAVGLVWRYGVAEAPTVSPPASTAPTPASPETTPGTTTAP